MSDNSAWKESISLEESNKIRVSLGLKPLSESGPSKTSDAIAEDNFAKRKDREAKERSANALKAKIDSARNKKERERKLIGVGLGAATAAADDRDGEQTSEGGAPAEKSGSGDLDTKLWVKMQKKKAKLLAAKREKELAEMEARLQEEGLPQYDERDLKGIKVAHGEEDFEEGEETVLTLKDSRILDDEDDELHNLNISENAKTAEALALKKKGKQAGAYTGFDDDEFSGEGAKRGVLNKYDEDIDGRAETSFRLGDAPVTRRDAQVKSEAKADDEETKGETDRVKLSMDYTKTFVTDYLQEDEVDFKKAKKKKKRPLRTKVPSLLEGENVSDGMDVDADAKDTRADDKTTIKVNFDETNLIDDDDLQLSLARARREQNKNRILEMKRRAKSVGTKQENAGDRLIKEEEENADESQNQGGVLIMDDTSEFVRNISLNTKPAVNGVKKEEVVPTKIEEKSRSAAQLEELQKSETRAGLIKVKDEPQDDVPISEVAGGWGSPREDGEESEGEEMYTSDQDRMHSPEGTLTKVKPEDSDLTVAGGESLVSKGLASTLSLLRQQGLMKPRTPEELERDRLLKEKEAWLAEQRKRDRERELERIRSREAGSSKDQQQREYENRLRDQREAQKALEAFNNYKPVVNITYNDEFGRNQTPKEAWKQLSHDFHGKGSGNKKTEKRLKKIADEQKREAMVSGDTPLSTASAFAQRAEKLGSATMILSVGNKNAAPVQDEMLANLQKSNAAKKEKIRNKGESHRNGSGANGSGVVQTTPIFSDIPMRPLPLPVTEGRMGSPAVRSGFAPVRSFSPVPAGPVDGTKSTDSPVSLSEKKLQIIPTSIKRKAVGEAEGSPASKRIPP